MTTQGDLTPQQARILRAAASAPSGNPWRDGLLPVNRYGSRDRMDIRFLRKNHLLSWRNEITKKGRRAVEAIRLSTFAPAQRIADQVADIADDYDNGNMF